MNLDGRISFFFLSATGCRTESLVIFELIFRVKQKKAKHSKIKQVFISSRLILKNGNYISNNLPFW